MLAPPQCVLASFAILCSCEGIIFTLAQFTSWRICRNADCGLVGWAVTAAGSQACVTQAAEPETELRKLAASNPGRGSGARLPEEETPLLQPSLSLDPHQCQVPYALCERETSLCHSVSQTGKHGEAKWLPQDVN